MSAVPLFGSHPGAPRKGNPHRCAAASGSTLHGKTRVVTSMLQRHVDASSAPHMPSAAGPPAADAAAAV